jgi:hypothetical protein
VSANAPESNNPRFHYQSSVASASLNHKADTPQKGASPD